MEMLSFFVLCFTSLFSIVNPFSSAVVFEIITKRFSKSQKLAIVKKATLTMVIVLVLFTLTGLLVLKFFGLTIDALRLGGGIYLIYLGLKMVNPMKSQKELHPHGHKELRTKEDIAVVPLAIPFLSGPGAITTTIVLVSQEQNVMGYVAVLAAILLVAVLTYIILRKADLIKTYFGHTGIKTLEKIMGILILCIGAQFILNGIKGFFGFGF